MTFNPKCNFCGIDEKRTEHMVSGPGVYICRGCAHFCAAILKEQGLWSEDLVDQEVAAYAEALRGAT